MIEYLPWYYRKSQVVNDVYEVIQKAIDEVASDIATEDLRLFITTTDDFTLHEKDVKLAVPSAADDETRRGNVIARLQGNGVFTVQALIDVVTAYEPTGCEVDENYANYTVYIKFANREGAPPDITAIMAAIEELKPAHIQFEIWSNDKIDVPIYIHTVPVVVRKRIEIGAGYATYGELDGLSYGDLDGLSYREIEGGVIDNGTV